MDKNLVRQVRGELTTPPADRTLTRAAKPLVDEVRLAALKVDGALALAAHVMEGSRELDSLRRELAGGDASLNLTLAEIEVTALQQVAKIQRGLYNAWGF